jgi:3-oxoacyl-(acyl-carrier-protein) synthase
VPWFLAMSNSSPAPLAVVASTTATPADLASARLGTRFGRLDLISQLALLAVEGLSTHFDQWRRDRVGICINVRAGSLSTDVDYWNGRDMAGGPSPMLFAYTLPSSAIGEIAIRHRFTGPNLCLIGDEAQVLAEARDWLARGEVDACVCVYCDVVSAAASELIQEPSSAIARAQLVSRAA